MVRRITSHIRQQESTHALNVYMLFRQIGTCLYIYIYAADTGARAYAHAFAHLCVCENVYMHINLLGAGHNQSYLQEGQVEFCTDSASVLQRCEADKMLHM